MIQTIPSLIPTTPSPTSDTDRPERHVALLPSHLDDDVCTSTPILTPTSTPTLTPAPTPTPSPTVGAPEWTWHPDAYDGDGDAATDTTKDAHRISCLWTSVPMRAIVPLPPRYHSKLAAQEDVVPGQRVCRAGAGTDGGTVRTDRAVTGTSPCSVRSVSRFWDDTAMASEPEYEGQSEDVVHHGEEGSDEDGDITTAPRCCLYESISATEGLSAWSFEELRVECYAQSQVARGTKPPPVLRPALAIPPAFAPRVVSRSQSLAFAYKA